MLEHREADIPAPKLAAPGAVAEGMWAAGAWGLGQLQGALGWVSWSGSRRVWRGLAQDPLVNARPPSPRSSGPRWAERWAEGTLQRWG